MDDEIQLKDIIAVVNRFKWLIILGTVLAVAVTLLITLQQPKVYQATAQILVSVEPLKRQTLEDMYYGTLMSEKLTNTFSQMALQATLLKKAAKQAKANFKKATLEVKTVPGTQLFTITLQYPDQKKAYLLANSLSQLLLKNVNQASNKIKVGFKPKLTVVESASLPEAPVKPSLKLNLAVSFVIGLLATLTLAFIINSFSPAKPAQQLNLTLPAEESKLASKV